MDVALSDEQRDLRDLVRDLTQREPAEGGVTSPLWRRLTGELGLTGVTVPEAHGGAGASVVELGVVVAELGRVLAPVPFLQTAVAATALARLAHPAASGILPGVAAGELVAGLASPGGQPPEVDGDGDRVRIDAVLDHVVDGPALDVVLLRARRGGADVLGLVALDGPGVQVVALDTLDRTRRQARIVLSGAALTVVGDSADADTAQDLLLTAVALESAAAAGYCLDRTVDHLKSRVQFGRPIGSFQALQHRCADLAVLVQAATSTAWYATWAADRAAGADGAAGADPVAAALAKAYCADAFRTVTAEMVQLHGGIGFTWEHPAHRYLKRAVSTDLLFGGRRWVRSALARHAGIPLGR